MAICPFAVKKLIPPGSSDPKITARVGVWHVDGGNASSLYDWFNGPSGGLESHFFITKDGVLEQYRDTAYQADAQWAANDFGLSVETQGFGDGVWTDAQIFMSQRLMRWMHAEHSIPLRKIQNWNGSGFGYHSLFPEWNKSNHSCPGAGRIKQFDQVLVPWLNKGAPKDGPTPNITDALHADNLDDRIVALRKVVHRGDDAAANAAAAWLRAIKDVQQARAIALDMRSQLKDLEVR